MMASRVPLTEPYHSEAVPENSEFSYIVFFRKTIRLKGDAKHGELLQQISQERRQRKDRGNSN